MVQYKNCLTLFLLLFFGLTVVNCNQSNKPPETVAIEELAELATAIREGVNSGFSLDEYKRLTSKMKTNVDAQLHKIPEGELKGKIKSAQEAYLKAESFWTSAATRNSSLAKFEEKSIKAALSIFWLSAIQDIKKAIELSGQPINKKIELPQ
jgi:hypothetical protein